ncbi:NAD(P)-dependent oxidoreductase [Cohnella thailandensis]|uniref:NAD(P)H-binding protein n=1 Tax=Cohnella thailandensis TaxID=557557 RepID=A0A841SUK1_9BACL|nr:NAD(P)H-binding protein [Cohnella thailandensis]MBB6633307.1 NAD(P)H-binding protein [Cohnella thailandensis]MBP1977356.1 putative NADH-flavin reductase [Cohnella thailandensis]
MKIIVFGATGNTGRRAVEQGRRMGHEMTAFVRNSEKFYEQQGERAEQVKVVADDILNPVSVAEALSHQDAAIIAAGHAGQGEEFVRLVDNIISQCEIHPSFAGRVWVMGGAGLLDIPYTDHMGNNLPGFPPAFQNHNRNYERLLRSELDWSIMCPATMLDSIASPASVHLHVTTDTLPLSVPKTIKELSEADIAGYLFSRLQEMDVAYEDVVQCMLDHMELGGPFHRKRVGLAYQSEIPQ